MNDKKHAYLDGGHVQGPGTSTSDSIEARLSDGEFVVKADVVKQPGMLEFLKKLNDEKFNFKHGGFVDIARKYGEFLAPGKVEQVYDNNPSSVTPSAVAPQMYPENHINKKQIAQNTIYPESKMDMQTASAPRDGINPKVLQDRVAAIQNEPDQLKQAILKSKLAEQLRNLQVDPSTLDNNYAEGGLVQDDSLFSDEPYQEAQAPQDDSLFEDTPHPESPKISAGRSALVGAGQGATFGFADELTAPVVATAGMVGSGINKMLGNEEDTLPTLPGESTLDKFQRLSQTYRDVAREEQQVAQEEHPLAYAGGAVAGGLLTMKVPVPGVSAGVKALGKAAEVIPGVASIAKAVPRLAKVATGATEGAGYGAAYGAGEAEGNLEERIPGALEGAETGALIGGAIPAAVGTIKTIGSGIKGVGKVGGLEPAGEAYLQGTKGTSILGKDAKTKEFSNLYEKSGNLVDDLKGLFKSTGEKIKAALKGEEGSSINLQDELEETFKKLDDMKQTQDGAKYANDIEAELKQILGIKPKPSTPTPDLPEGLILPKDAAEKIDLSNITPQQAQDIKQVMFNYSPKGNAQNITAQTFEQAKVAGDVSRAAKESLADLSPALSEANKEYSALSNAYDRLKINDKLLPEQQKANVAKLLSNLEKGNLTAHETQQVINDVIADIKTVSPEVAAKYGKDLNEISKRLDLIGQMQGGTNFGQAGILKRASIAGGNLIGQGVNKLGSIPGVETTKTFAKVMLDSPASRKSLVAFNEQPSPETETVEPYKLQRQVAQAAETAEPETLKNQAQDIRTKYGKQGEQLATILDNMAGKDKNARRALMFTVLQNQAYRKMLGLMKEAEK